MVVQPVESLWGQGGVTTFAVKAPCCPGAGAGRGGLGGRGAADLRSRSQAASSPSPVLPVSPGSFYHLQFKSIYFTFRNLCE